jgi:hypothetical protein
MQDPDGYLIEVGQSTGLLAGKLANKRPEDLPGQGGATTGVPSRREAHAIRACSRFLDPKLGATADGAITRTSNGMTPAGSQSRRSPSLT